MKMYIIEVNGKRYTATLDTDTYVCYIRGVGSFQITAGKNNEEQQIREKIRNGRT